MRIVPGRLAAIVRAAAFVAAALTLASPASAQFGGLKKKLKSPTATATDAAGVPAPATAAPTGGTVVLTDDVVAQLISGLEAAAAERQAAANADTPYGRYHKAMAAYDVAKPKCQAAQQTFATRMAGDEKMSNKYSGFIDKMVAAQTKGDQQTALAYNDSAMAMMDPSCVVKQPTQPENYYETKREVDSQAEQKAIKQSRLAPAEYSQGMEKAEAIVRGGPVPGDVSESEKNAVTKRSAELKRLLGISEVPAATKPTPPPAPAPAPPPSPTMTEAQSDMAACMAENSKKNEKQVIALGERMKAAQEAGDMNAVMAMADTLSRLQSAGCAGAR